MKCDLKTMIKIGLVLGGIIAIGAIAFPQFRPAIIGLAQFALFALCPISMFFAMHGMNKDQGHHDSCAPCRHQHEKVTIKDNHQHE